MWHSLHLVRNVVATVGPSQRDQGKQTGVQALRTQRIHLLVIHERRHQFGDHATVAVHSAALRFDDPGARQ